MIIETGHSHVGEIWIMFEEPDFRLKDKWGKELWIECKEAIKERFPFPEARWDSEIKAWIVKDTPGNREEIRAIHRLYFGNENQEEISL